MRLTRSPVRLGDIIEMRGVGLLLLPDSEGAVRVMGLAQGSPAELCGRIQKGDILAEVDGVIVYKQPLEKCEERISGPWYSHVELVFYGNEEKSFKYRVQLQRLATLQVPISIPEQQFADRRSRDYISPHKQPSFVTAEKAPEIMAKKEAERLVEALTAMGFSDAHSRRAALATANAGIAQAIEYAMSNGSRPPTTAAPSTMVKSDKQNVQSNFAELPNKQPSFVSGEGGVGIMFFSVPNGSFVVADLVPDGPAQLSGGIHPGDTITEIDGNKVSAHTTHVLIRNTYLQLKHSLMYVASFVCIRSCMAFPKVAVCLKSKLQQCFEALLVPFFEFLL